MFNGFHFFIGMTTYPDVLICNHATMTSYFHKLSFPYYIGSVLTRMAESRNAFKFLMDKPAGKKPLGRPRRRWEDNIRMDLKEIGIDTRNLVDSAQYYWRALVNEALNLRVPKAME
jgi:hypothetical protein